MKLVVEFPSVAHREGPEAVARLARTIEDIGYHELDMFDHVVYADADQVVRRVVELQSMGFEWAAINATAIFQSGARSVDLMIDRFRLLHDRIRRAVDGG